MIAHDLVLVEASPPIAPPLPFTLGAEVTLGAAAPLILRLAIRQALTVPNPLYREAEEQGRSTRDLEAELRYYRQTPDGDLVIPRGAGRTVHALCREYDVPVHLIDEAHEVVPVMFEERVTLSAAQERAVGDVLKRRIGVLEAPAGSGKTIMAMSVIARRRQPTLIIVHTRELAHQAIARAMAVVGLDEAEIGVIGDGQCTIGERLTVALVQTLARGVPPALLQVGHVVVDECHHCPAVQMAAVVSQFPAKFLLGLSATPYRRDGLDRVIGWYLGPVVARIDKADLADRLIAPTIIKRETGCVVAGDSFTELVTDLIHDPRRNRLIVADVAQAVREGRRCLVLSDRVDHVERLTKMLAAAGVSAAALHGQLGKRTRGEVVAMTAAGTVQAVVATGSLIGEGFDSPRLDALFLATPVSYVGRVTQYIGRVSRTAPGKTGALVVDYCDDNRMLWASWGKRGRLYRSAGLPITSSPAATAVPSGRSA